jgi:hypothetical protein
MSFNNDDKEAILLNNYECRISNFELICWLTKKIGITFLTLDFKTSKQ